MPVAEVERNEAKDECSESEGKKLREVRADFFGQFSRKNRKKGKIR